MSFEEHDVDLVFTAVDGQDAALRMGLDVRLEFVLLHISRLPRSRQASSSFEIFWSTG